MKIKVLYEKLKYENLKTTIKNINSEIKDIKNKLKLEKNDLQRSYLYHEKYILSMKLSGYYSEYNKIKNKNNSHKLKIEKPFFTSLKNLIYPVNFKVLVYQKDNKLDITLVKGITTEYGVVAAKIKDLFIEQTFKNEYTLYNLNTIGINEAPNFIIDNEVFFSHFFAKKNKIFLYNFDMYFDLFKIDKTKIVNLEEFYQKVIYFQELLKIELDYEAKRKQILNQLKDKNFKGQ